ncbi:hypothetical protein WOLCODRAFT_84518 [Wolfiporia cocos MD-104 SS10]|uniref:Uncharacterized protein n=1 Tax=Wolfiporia cocos (strain MD-104) TaxID=742152 RepID=A0A2H3J599_WOLCO|nr:hypothetical protein WOLCODRAFT_84518 [Wolfiporia cocos MD-104 SS10]
MADTQNIGRPFKSGHYTITNVAYANRIKLSNADDGEQAVGRIPFDEELINPLELWQISRSSEGSLDRCTIKNIHLNRFLSTKPTASHTDTVFGDAQEYCWILYADDSSVDVYRICTPSTLCLTLKDGCNDTPVSSPDQDTMTVQLEWNDLPPRHVLRLFNPVSVIFHGEIIADAHVDEEFHTDTKILNAALHARDTNAFRKFIHSVLCVDEIQISFEARGFHYFHASQDRSEIGNYEYRIPWKKDLIFKGLQSFRDKVLLKRLTITASGPSEVEPYLDIELLTSLINNTNLTCIADYSVSLYYGASKARTISPKSPNQQIVKGRFQPLTPPVDEIRRFLGAFLTSNRQQLVKLRVEGINITICGRLFNLPGFEINSYLQGLGAQIVHHVDVYLKLFPYFLQRRISFRFFLKNPIDTDVMLKGFSVDAYVKGVCMAHVKHVFQTPLLLTKEGVWSPKIGEAFLDAGYFRSWQLVFDHAAVLDLKIRSIDIS